MPPPPAVCEFLIVDHEFTVFDKMAAFESGTEPVVISYANCEPSPGSRITEVSMVLARWSGSHQYARFNQPVEVRFNLTG
jgi:hypothetical protein